MMNETDLPCADCGNPVEERRVPVAELGFEPGSTQTVTVAVCTSCDARYYPDDTLQRLYETAADSPPDPDAGCK